MHNEGLDSPSSMLHTALIVYQVTVLSFVIPFSSYLTQLLSHKFEPEMFTRTVVHNILNKL